MALNFLAQLGIYAASQFISYALKGKKRQKSPIYKERESNEDYSQERAVPVVYGFNKVRGEIVYREDKDGNSYDLAVAFCEGEIEEIGKVIADDVNFDSLSAPNAITRYTGTSTQTADSIMETGVYRLKVSEDAYTDLNNADTNYNTDTLWALATSGDTAERYTFLKFDLSALPADLTVEKVWLEMHVKTQVSNSHVLYSSASESWAEDTITWNTMPALGSAISGNCGPAGKNGLWDRGDTTINATGVTLIQTQYDAGSTCTVIITADTDGQSSSWYSKDSVYLSPHLCIEFSGGDGGGFRNTAYAAMTVSCDSKQAVITTPTVEAEIKGLKILNWDADGSAWQTTYNYNPAWVLYDWLKQTRYAMGISTTYIDTETFKTAAAHCDESVTVDGVTVNRFECHIVLDDRRPGDDHVNDILATFCGYLYQQDGKLCLGVEKSDTPDGDFAFTESNIITGSFSYWQAEREKIPNVIRVLYTDPERDFVKTHAQAEDITDIEDRGRIIKEVSIYGCNSHHQAARLAQYILYKGLLTKFGCSFNVSINHCHITPGILCTVTHTVPAWTAKQFRIVEIQETDRDEIEVTCEEYVAGLYTDEGQPDGYNEQTALLSYEDAPVVTALTCTETFEISDDGIYQPQIQVAFTEPDNNFYLHYVIYLQKESGDFVVKANVTGSPYIINVSEYTSYTVRVVTINSLSQRYSTTADSPTDTLSVTGQANTPALPVTSGIVWSTDSKAEWTTGSIYYKGVTYAIDSGDTTNPFIYFDPDVSTTVLQDSASFPTLGANGWIMATYDSVADEVYPTIPMKNVNADLLTVGTILARPYQTAASGARLLVFPDANTGLQVIDNGAADVLKVIVGGDNVGDVVIGNYSGGQGLMYDKSTGAFHVRGDLDVTSVNWSDVVDDGHKPDNDADVTATVLTAKGIADGATVGATWGSNVASVPAHLANADDTPTADGVYITPNFIGYWDNGTTTWTVRIKNNSGTGEFYVGNGTNKYVSWDGSALEVMGNIQTAGTGAQRIKLDNSDNTLKLYNSSNALKLKIDDSLTGHSRPGILCNSTSGGVIDLYSYLGADERAYMRENQLIIYTKSAINTASFTNSQTTSTDATAILFLQRATSETGKMIICQSGTTTKFSVDTPGNVVAQGYMDAVAGFKDNGSAGADGTITVVTAVQLSSNTLQYKTRSLTFGGGIITTIGAESGWTGSDAVTLVSHALNDHSDVTAPTPAGGQQLTWSSGMTQWIADTA